MAINKKLIHFTKQEFFERELANGNILDHSICFILDTNLIWTHGTYYDCSTYNPSEIEASIEEIIKTKADKTEIPIKVSQLENDSQYLTSVPNADVDLGLVKSGGDVTIVDGVITVDDDSHNHIIDNIDGLQDALDDKVSISRTINGYVLSNDISLNYEDVGADVEGAAGQALIDANNYTDQEILTLSKLIENDLTSLDNKKVNIESGKGLSTEDYTTGEKEKLANIYPGAEVNQNAFAKVKIGNTTIEADSKLDTLVIEAGTNITITGDANNDKVVISAWDTTYENATNSEEGLMSAEDKAKLDTIEELANYYILPEATESQLGGVTIGDNITLSSGEISINLVNVTTALGYTPPMLDTTYEEATAYEAGLMSSQDKSKLDNIAEGANNYSLPTATSDDLGGIKVGFVENGNKIPVVLDSEQAYVEVSKNAVTTALGYTPPELDTTYNTMEGAGSNKNGSEGLVPLPFRGDQDKFLKGDGTWDTPVNITYEFEGGTNLFTVTPSNGNSETIDIIPSIQNNVTYSGNASNGEVPIFDGNTGLITASGYTINKSVPSDAIFTDTIYEPPTYDAYTEDAEDETPDFGNSFSVTLVKTNYLGHVTSLEYKNITIPNTTATSSISGLMSSSDKFKLDNIEENAEVNQNAFSTILVGLNNITADSKEASVTIKGEDGVDVSSVVNNITIKHGNTSTLNGDYGPTDDVLGIDGNTIIVPQITVDLFGHVTNVIDRTYTSVNTTYDTMTATDLISGVDTDAKVTTAKVISDFVKSQIDDKIAAADAMIYKGTIGSNGTVISLPSTHKTGWTYKVITAGTYAGIKCEVGDMIICLTDGTSSNNSHWTVVLNNIDGAVTNTATSVAANTIAVFDGTSGKAIKSSNYTISTSVPANAVFTDSKVTSVGNHYDPVENTSSALNASGATATDISGNTVQVVTGIKRDAKGHIVGITSGAVKATDTKSFTITANSSDDDVVILTGTNGTNAVTYSASHAEKGPKDGYTSDNTTTTISGTGGSIKIPQISVDKYGHVTSAVDEQITITLPSIPTLLEQGGISTVSASGTAPLTLSASKEGTAVSITGSVAGMKGASSNAAGSAGLVPAPASGKDTSFLRGDGQWAIPANDNTTYTFANGTNGFTVTPKGGTAQTVTVTPSITNNVTYSGTLTSGQVTVLDGTTGKIKASGYTIASNVPANAKFTDTTYSVASTSQGGLMSSAMVTKLNGVQSGATAVSFTRSLTSGTKIGTITINGAGTDIYCNNNTTYSAGTGLTLSGTTFNHSNSVTAKTAYGSTATTASANGGKITVTDVKYDAQGHITGSTDRTITLSQDHTKTDVTAGTAGTSSATSGKTIAVPYVTVNANGHVTGYGTHTHTIDGFLTAETYKGTVTSVATGVGLTGGTITNTGTLKAKLRNETPLTVDATTRTEATDKVYPVGVDKSGYLAVNVPWTTYTAATTTAAGLMSAGDKTKLEGIETGALKNTITGVKGNSESSYRTGNVNITKSNIGLGNVDNTSDANKPISTATQAALDSKAPTSHASTETTYGVGTTANYGHVKISNGDADTVGTANGLAAGMDHTHSLLAPKNSPAFTGTPTAPTAVAGTNTTQIATTAFVTSMGNTKLDKNIYFNNVTASSWVADTTYADFGYVCSLSCSGVTDAMYAEVVFDVAQAISGKYAPVCETGSNIVKIWSSTNDSITIPVIIVHK